MTGLPPARIDTIGVTFPIDQWSPDAERRTSTGVGTPEEQHRYSAPLPGGGTAMWPVAHRVKIEASLPKRDGEDNIEAVQLHDALRILEGAHREAAEFVRYDEHAGGDRIESGRITRLDLVRDFHGVHEISRVLNGLATVPVAGRSKQVLHADGDRNHAQTLTIGPKSWKARFYDKHAETDGLARPGQVRFEAELRKAILASTWAIGLGGAVKHVADLEEHLLRALTLGMFERVGFGHEVVGLNVALARVRAARLPRQTENGLVNYLVARVNGVQPLGSPNTLRKYRTIAAQIGVVALDVTTPSGSTVRLDYGMGRLVGID